MWNFYKSSIEFLISADSFSERWFISSAHCSWKFRIIMRMICIEISALLEYVRWISMRCTVSSIGSSEFFETFIISHIIRTIRCYCRLVYNVDASSVIFIWLVCSYDQRIHMASVSGSILSNSTKRTGYRKTLKRCRCFLREAFGGIRKNTSCKYDSYFVQE